MLDEAPQARSVGHNQDLLAGAHLRYYGIGPFRNHSLHGGFQRFRQREVRIGNVPQFGIVPNSTVVRIVRFDRWWWDVEATAPHLDLRFAIDVGHLTFVESGQGTVVAFVQTPQLVDRDVGEVQLSEYDLEGLVGSAQAGREGNVEGEVLALQGGGRDFQCVPFTWIGDEKDEEQKRYKYKLSLIFL